MFAWPTKSRFSVYNFETANVERLWRLLAEHEAECKELLASYAKYPDKKRFPGAANLRSGAEVLQPF